VARVLRCAAGRWEPGLGATGVAVRRIGSVGVVRLFGALGRLGAGVGSIGTVRLLGSVGAVGHLTPVDRGRIPVHRRRIRGSRLRVGQLGVLGQVGRFGLAVGERWRPRCCRSAGQLGPVGVVRLLRSLGSVRAVGVHERVGTVGALGGFWLLGQLGVLGAVGFVRHPAGWTATVGRFGTLRSTRVRLVLELGARIRFLRVARTLAPARPFASSRPLVATCHVIDPDERSLRGSSEEGRTAGATRSEEGRP